MKSTFKHRSTKIALLSILSTLLLVMLVVALNPHFFQLRTERLSFVAPVQRVLVVFAHPDDEVTNAGLIRHWAEGGADITLLTLSDGSANPESDTSVCPQQMDISECRIEELRTAAKHLGIKKIVTAMLPDSALIHHMPQAVERISEEILALRPDVILTMEPSGLNGQEDHRTLFPALAASIQKTGHSAQILLSTLPWPISYFLRSKIPTQMRVSLRVFPTSADLRKVKVAVAEAHKSQLKTIQGLTLGLGPALLFRWLNFETYSLLSSDELTQLN